MQEIEAKFYIREPGRMHTRIMETGARLIQDRILETNLRFDLPDGSLRAERRLLRLRHDTVARLTYKGPGVVFDGVWSRPELEMVVEDFGKAESLLQELGYQVIFIYEKYRTSFEMDAAHISLDELPVGNFLEIEGADARSIKAVADRLGLDWEQTIEMSYHILYDRLCKRRADLDSARLTFDALAGKSITPEELSVRAADG